MSLRSRAAAVAITALALFTAACGVVDENDGAPTSGGSSLRLVTVFPANTTDPHVNQSSFILNTGAVERLVGLDVKTGALAPELATQWSSQDGRAWTFTIRDGVRFHNGEPVDAEAVRASLSSSIEKNPGMKIALRIADMAAEGQRLSVTTEDVHPSLPSELVHFNTAIVDVDAGGDLPIGTGPFVFTSFAVDGDAVLRRNDDYWGGPAKLEHVTMSANADANSRMLALRSGQADVIHQPSLESLDALRADENVVVESVPGARVYNLLYNLSGPRADLFASTEFRRGIGSLLNRSQITETILHGQAQPVDNPFTPDRPIAPKPAPAQEGPEAALAHFQNAGLTVADGRVSDHGQPISLTLATYVARAELPQIAQLLNAAGAQVGIDIAITTVDNIDEYLATDDWDISTYSIVTFTRGDGAYFVNGAFMPGGAQNAGGIDDPRLTSLIEDYNTTVAPDRRTEKMREIASYVRDNAYNAYLGSPNATAAYSTRVTGWVTPSSESEYPMITTQLDVE